MPFLGFGQSCFEQSLNQIRVVAPLLDGITNADQNPALLHRPVAYQAASLELSPWQANSNFNPYTTALKASIQKQFRKGGSWSMRYENFSLSPLSGDSRDFFSDIPALGSLFRLAYATPLSEHWSVGVAAKYAQREISNNAFFLPFSKSRAWAADLGFRYHNSKEISSWQKLNWQWGLSLSNLGAKVASEITENEARYLPTALSLGFLLEEEFRLRGTSLFRIRGAYQINKLLVPNPCPTCDDDADGVANVSSHSALKGVFTSLADSPAGFRGELQEINHQFDMSMLYQFNARFAVNAKASLFYQHPELGGVQYLASQLGFRWRSIHFDMTFWRPNASQTVIVERQLSLSLAYQHFFTSS
jgi:hypothetical protein